ncbi:DUF6457 domain-containing protein [Actinotalea sp. C106]|uniref:DUF6457 domain-containing protein n=1 Tax=Actinotalea sp. C106 TaxID=2908644 RepID=UPI002027F836|nr:DUF6457 domain-containing protein [Actinotalea sp. C106]
MSDSPALGSELHRWIATTGEELGVDPDAVAVDELLDLARDVAHGVARPAAPLTTFLVGYAVGASSGDRAALDDVLALAVALVESWGTEEAGR